mmetsp:Transcript_3797/g.5100  ORF Transcript_3797/g.5100 Transcript_3797/m.5100 type:complete len:116 (-) Transcript_3797:1715-2062(-)
MLEFIKAKYPDRYTLPGEIEIKQEIGSLFLKRKMEKTRKNKTRKPIPKPYLDKLRKYLEKAGRDYAELKPKDVFAKLISQFSSAEGLQSDFPDEKTVKARFSGLKTIHKTAWSVT